MSAGSNPVSQKPGMSRETLLPALAAHVLQHGLGTASLRPLAKAAGTSDRMLIYHFGNKEQLISHVLGHIAATYAAALDAGLGGERAGTRAECAGRILAQSREPVMQPFLMLWWEIVAGSARGAPGYRAAAQAVMTRLLDWLETQMPQDDPDPVQGARFVLTMIEGAQMLSAVGHARTAREGLVEGLKG